METCLSLESGNTEMFFSYRNQGGKLQMQEWWFKCCDFKLDWRKHHFSSPDPWAMNSLFVRGCITPHYSPAWLMSPCCDGPREIWGMWWEMVSSVCEGPPAMSSEGSDDQGPLIYDIIHSIPSTVTWLMYLTRNCPLNLSWHSTQDNGPWWQIEAVSSCFLSV